MKAALIHAISDPPQLGQIDDPQPGPDDVLIDLLAAPVNPVDIAISEGRFYAGHPPLPFVPCVEGVGTVVGDGRLVFTIGGVGVKRNGAASERFTAPAASLIDLPKGADPALAGSLGTAGLAGWLPIAWRANTQPGETVLVLGATGTAGRVAVAAARHVGAGKIVAAGRNRERLAELEDTVDTTVSLADADCAEQLAAACAPGADVIYDPLWGTAIVSALGATKVGTRIVHLGTSSGPDATLPSAIVRGRQLTILGYSNFAAPRPVLIDAYLTMVGLSMSGGLDLDVHRVPLDDAAKAWSGQKAGEGKFALIP